FELAGYICYRSIEPDGKLSVSGPPGALEHLRTYWCKYAPICQESSFLEFVASIPPFGEAYLELKKHAMLELLVIYEEEIKNGMGISAALVKDVLDSIPFPL